MGSWHQDIIPQGIEDSKVNSVEKKVIDYLIRIKVISPELKDDCYPPGENWWFAVNDKTEDGFLDSTINGLEIRNRKTIFYADGRDFEIIGCPNCGENNAGCDWGELFNAWSNDSNSAQLKCKNCQIPESITAYNLEPKWGFGNLGFVFWNWPPLSDGFISKLEELIGKKIDRVEGKL